MSTDPLGFATFISRIPNIDKKEVTPLDNNQAQGYFEYASRALQQRFSGLRTTTKCNEMTVSYDWVFVEVDEALRLCQEHNVIVPLQTWIAILKQVDPVEGCSRVIAPEILVKALVSVIWSLGNDFSKRHPSDNVLDAWVYLKSLLYDQKLCRLDPLTCGRLEKMICSSLLALNPGDYPHIVNEESLLPVLFSCILKTFTFSEEAAFRIVSIMSNELSTLFESYVNAVIASKEGSRSIDAMPSLRNFFLLNDPKITWPIARYLMRNDIFPLVLSLLLGTSSEGMVPLDSFNRCEFQIELLSNDPSWEEHFKISYQVSRALTCVSDFEGEKGIKNRWKRFVVSKISEIVSTLESCLSLSSRYSNLYMISGILEFFITDEECWRIFHRHQERLISLCFPLLHEPPIPRLLGQMIRADPKHLKRNIRFMIASYVGVRSNWCSHIPSFISFFTDFTCADLNYLQQIQPAVDKALSSCTNDLFREFFYTKEEKRQLGIMKILICLSKLVSPSFEMCFSSVICELGSKFNTDNTYFLTEQLRLFHILLSRSSEAKELFCKDEREPLIGLFLIVKAHRSHSIIVVLFFKILEIVFQNDMKEGVLPRIVIDLFSILTCTHFAKHPDALYSNSLKALHKTSHLWTPEIKSHHLFPIVSKLTENYTSRNTNWNSWCISQMNLKQTHSVEGADREDAEASKYLGIKSALLNLLDNITGLYNGAAE